MLVQDEFELENRGEEHYYTYPEEKKLWAKANPQTPVPDILLTSVSVVQSQIQELIRSMHFTNTSNSLWWEEYKADL